MLTNSNFHIETNRQRLPPGKSHKIDRRVSLKWMMLGALGTICLAMVATMVFTGLQLHKLQLDADNIIRFLESDTTYAAPGTHSSHIEPFRRIDQYQQSVSLLIVYIVVCMAVLFVVIAVGAVVFYGILSKRLKQVVENTHELARGNMSADPGIVYNDEVGDLSVAIYRMGESLASVVNIANEKAEFAEQALTVSNNKSQLLVLQREELQRAKDAAEYSTKSKTQFVAQISHELRTPMNAIKGSLDLLQQTPLNDEQLQMVRLAQGSSTLLLRVINDVVDLSKIETGVITISDQGFDIIQQVHDILELLGSVPAFQDVAIELNIDRHLHPLISSDPDRYTQILINLLMCLVEQTAGKRIRIDLTSEPGPGNSYVLMTKIHAHDTQFAEQMLKVVVDMFAQQKFVHKSASHLIPIGLRICKHLVEMMGGKIGMCNGVNNSCYFWFKLNVDKLTNDEWLSQRPQEVLQLDKRVLLLSANIQAINTQICVDTMSSWGMEVVVRRLCTQVMDVLHDTDSDKPVFDAILVDYEGADAAVLEKLKSTLSKENEFPVLVFDTAGIFVDTQVYKLDKPVVYSQLKKVITVIADKRDEPVSHKTKNDDESLHIQQKQILLVEDDEINQQFSRLVLTRLGHHVEVANNGVVALQSVQQKAFDLIFMDCQMPQMDGFTATKEIRMRQKSGKLAEVPIVAMTANAMEGDREKCLAAGMDDYISKPINQQDLQRVLRYWLCKRNNRVNNIADD